MVAIAHHLEAHRARCAALRELFERQSRHVEKHFREQGLDYFDKVAAAAEHLGKAAEGREPDDVSEAVLVVFGISLLAEIGGIACSLAWAGYEMTSPDEQGGNNGAEV